MCILILYRIHHRHRVDGRAIRYKNLSDSSESDIVYAESKTVKIRVGEAYKKKDCKTYMMMVVVEELCELC